MGLKVHGALFLVSLLYAILFSWAGEIMPRYISAEAFVWLRIVTAFVLFNITSLFFRREKIDWKSDLGRFAVCAFFGTAANMLMFFKGLSLTKPINGAVLMMVTPLFVAFLEHIIHKKQPGFNTVLGFTLGTMGAVMLMWTKGAGFSSETLAGDLWVAVNAAFYAVYLVLAKKLANKYHTVTVNRITFGFGVLYIAPFGMLPLLGTDFSSIPSPIWAKIGYILFFTSFLVYLLNTYGMKHADASLVGIYIYLQPLLAAVIAVVLGRDEMTLTKGIFAAMIIYGVWLVTGKKKLRFSPAWRK